MNDSQKKISQVCDEIKNMLLDKNLKYGNSALNPVRFMSSSSPVEQILVRIDDKLNRIKQGGKHVTEDEDVINDLIGYFVLLKISIEQESKNKETIEHFTDLQFCTDVIENRDLIDNQVTISYNKNVGKSSYYSK
jgi:hypothetical protein